MMTAPHPVRSAKLSVIGLNSKNNFPSPSFSVGHLASNPNIIFDSLKGLSLYFKTTIAYILKIHHNIILQLVLQHSLQYFILIQS
jgi:hypothetical protein